MVNAESDAVRLARLEVHFEALEKEINRLSEAVTWLTRAIFGLMATALIGIAVGVLSVIQSGGG